MAAAKCGTTSSASPLEFIQRDTAAVVQLSIRFTESCARRSRARVTRREPHEGAATRVPVLSMTHVFTRHRRQREGRGRGRRACHPVCMLQHVAIVESVPKRKSKFLSRLLYRAQQLASPRQRRHLAHQTRPHHTPDFLSTQKPLSAGLGAVRAFFTPTSSHHLLAPLSH